ncbi:NADH-quinone oxidoreductase subunit H [subsurface metagenome]
MTNYLIQFLIFPGFVFTSVCGCIASWIDRKVTARVQWRVGPPLLQPFYDFIKLLGKETIVPKYGARLTFLAAPLFALAAITLVSTLIWRVLLWPGETFVGDLIVAIYLLTIPSIAVIISGASSGNPLASLGASREMKLILGYELPFILAMFVPVIQTGGVIRLGELLTWQWTNHIFLGSWSGFIAFLVAIICMQAKLTLVPFDMPEAETEIAGGAYIEYSGPPLALCKLTRWMMLFVVPMFLVTVFMGGIVFSGWHILWGILKYVVLLVIIILIRNTNPRIRVDQAIKFFWLPVTALAIIAAVLAFIGI